MAKRLLTAILVLAPLAGARAAVVLSQRYAQMVAGQTLAFSASQSVVWQVNNIVGGNSDVGTVTAGGVFTAPAALPASGSVTVTAVSAANPLVSATATITLLQAAGAGRVYYVSVSGADSNPGTLASPFRTIQHGADVAQAGDTVLVRQGVYRALVTPTRFGAATGGYITLSSYPGELATIDGTGLPIPGGQNGLITLNNASYFIVQGFELRNYTTASVKQVPIGIYVTGAGSHVQIINNHVHAITTTAATTPNACASDALGVAVYGSKAPAAIADIVLSGNELNAMKTGCSETMTLNGNVSGFTVTSNLVHDDNNIGIVAIGFEGTSPDVAYDQARGGEIRGNTVYNITSYGNPDYGNQYAADGIYVDGGTDIVIEQNMVHHVDLGIELASEHKGRLTSAVIARNNVIYSDTSNGISIGGYGPARGGTAQCTIVNNTLFADDIKKTGSGELQIQYNATGNLFANNVVYATRQALMLNGFTVNAAAPAVLENNLYFSLAGGAASQFVWNGKTYAGLATYQTASGQDAQAVFADPVFARTSLPPVLSLGAGSPALGAGAVLGAVGSVDFAGTPRVVGGKVSVGAYQN